MKLPIIEKNYRAYSVVLIALLALVYIRGLWIPLMHNDSAHHANIAVHMHNSGDYISLIDRQNDYLDKPHFLFWAAALAFKFFGVSAFSFKITSLFFGLLCVFSTYHLAKIFYSAQVARVSILIMITSYSFMLAFNDVRMEAILTGAITFSLWQLLLFFNQQKIEHALLSALGLAIGFSTKGLIGIAIPAIGLGLYMIQQNSIHKIFCRNWLPMGAMTFLLIGPVLYCYYIQFDLHPEKIIRDTAGNSGVTFILLGQTLERIDGSSSSLNFRTGDPLFYIHTLLWAFLPWTIIGVTAWVKTLSGGIKNRFSGNKNDVFFFLFFSIIIFTFSIVSSKLPHYLTVAFPFLSILTASYILQERNEFLKKIRVGQQLLIVILLILSILICFYFVPIQNWLLLVYLTILFFVVVIFWMVQLTHESERIILMTVSSGVLLFSVLNFHFFPSVMKYQGGDELANEVIKQEIPLNKIAYLDDFETANDFDFHLKKNIPSLTISEILNKRDTFYIISGDNGYKALEARNLGSRVIAQAKNYHPSKLNFKFLNPSTRESVLKNLYIIQLTRAEGPYRLSRIE